MKKHLLLATSLLLFASTMSFGQSKQKLDSRVLQEWDESYYSYNDKGLIDSTYMYVDGYMIIESYKKYTYNEKGLCIEQNDFQMLDGEFRQISHIEYKYNDKDQMIKRYNYNSNDGVNFNPGGELIWTYNEDGSIAKITTSLPSWENKGEWDLFTVENYIYNDDKTLKKVEIKSVPFDGTPEQMYLSSTSDYNYNNKKQMVSEIRKYYYEDTGSTPASAMKNTYKYDEFGNLTEYCTYPSLSSSIPELKYVYQYDLNTQSNQVVYPFNFEDNKLAVYLTAAAISPNRIEKEEWWQIDNNSTDNRLEHVGDYVWTYSDFTDTGIQNINLDVNSASYYINDNTLYFSDLKEGSPIHIYSINGAKVIDTKYKSSGISLSNLAKGGYIVKIDNFRIPVKFVR